MDDDVWSYRDGAWSEGDAVVGYDVEATDGSIGKVDEATAETDRGHLVVDTGPWILGKKRLIPAGLVHEVDHDAEVVRVALSKDQVRSAPDFDEMSDEARAEHTDYYGRQGSS
jgi:hypothetical protein